MPNVETYETIKIKSAINYDMNNEMTYKHPLFKSLNITEFIRNTCKFFFRWNTIDLALTLRSLTSHLLPHSTIGMFSQTRTRSRCQFGTFLYVMRAVTSNMMTAHWPDKHVNALKLTIKLLWILTYASFQVLGMYVGMGQLLSVHLAPACTAGKPPM